MLDEQYTLDWLEAHTEKVVTSMTCPGQCAGTLAVDAPPPYLWFSPIAAAMRVYSEHTRDRGVIRITSVSIRDKPQELFHCMSPTAATREYAESVLWDPVEIARARPKLDGCRARPVRWKPFSVCAMMRELRITFFNPHPAGTNWRVHLTIYGTPSTVDPGLGRAG